MEQDEIREMLKLVGHTLALLLTKVKAHSGDDARWAEAAVKDAVEDVNTAVKHLEG